MATSDLVRRSILLAGLDRTSTPATTRDDTGATIGDDELVEIVQWAAHERIDGLAWLCLAGPETSWHLSDVQRTLVLEAHLDGLRATLASEATAVWAIDVLDHAGIPAWLMKGLASGHVDYPDPALRASFDADLLVDRDQFGPALDALLAAGCRRTAPALRGWWERRYARAVALVTPDGIEIDLHAALVDGRFGVTLDHARLRHDSVTIVLAGRPCRVLSPAARLLAASYALVLSRGPTLRLARDITQMTVVGGVDVETARRLAGDGSAIIDEALRRSAALLGLRSDDDSHPGCQHAGPSSGWPSDAMSAWRALSMLDRPLYALGVLAPTREHLAWRGLTRRRHLQRLARRAVAARRGAADR